MHIALFNVHYSENLGDGLLSQCLSREIAKGHPYAKVTSYDLAGRNGYGEGSKRRNLAHLVLDSAPRSIRNMGMELALGSLVRNQLRPRWAEALSEADCAVLGGGNLLSDINLNFPLKISGLCAELKRSQKPWALFGVGASHNWSNQGRQLFESAFSNAPPAYVAVRDERSKKLWDSSFSSKGAKKAEVCYDPAVLACDHFPIPKAHRPNANAAILGLNITAPQEISRHSEEPSLPVHKLTAWWADLTLLATQAGYEVRLFTNGNEGDDRFLQAISSRVSGQRIPSNAKLSFLPRPLRPDALAGIISSCDVIAGHRMHAHIPAFSYQIPTVGFGWDIKLRSFFESVGRSEFLLEVSKSTPSAVLECIVHAHRTGVSRATWLAATAGARRNVAELVASLNGFARKSGVGVAAMSTSHDG